MVGKINDFAILDCGCCRMDPRFRACEKLVSGAGILPASDANSGGNAWFPASPKHGRDARATRFSNFFTRSDQGDDGEM
jgi:hypothetical protein